VIKMKTEYILRQKFKQNRKCLFRGNHKK